MNDIRTLWKDQPLEGNAVLALDELRARSARLAARIGRRNLVLYLYAAFNVAAGAWLIAADRFPTMQAPMLLMLGAHVFVAWQVWLRLRARDIPPAATAQAVLDFQRAELTRQHDAARNAWLWYIAPFMPAFVWELAIWHAGIDAATPEGAASLRAFGLVVLGGVLFWTCVWLWFSRDATRLQLELHRLHSLRAE